MKLTIVAFLTRSWLPEGTEKELIYAYKTKQEVHRQILRTTATGYRLVQAFGDKMFNRIHWDNVCPEVTDHPRKRSPVEIKHVESVITVLRPHLILTFGEIANEAIKESVAAIRTKVMACHHPNARYKYQVDLDMFAQRVWDYVLLTEREDEFNAGMK